MTQYELNNEIENFIRSKDANRDTYNQEDIKYIQQYEGSGGQIKQGAQSTAKGGNNPLYEFYTPDYICSLMYQLAVAHGYKGGTVLEPACATGRLIAPIPDKKKVTAFEVTPITKRIAEISYPEATIHGSYFETAFLQQPRFNTKLPKNKLTWLKGYPFELVIGNPPYGKFASWYSSYFKADKIAQVEQFFMYYGAKLLKPGGLLVYLTSSNYLRNGITYNPFKEKLGELVELTDAYRLPPVFKNSQVPTDIIVFKRK